MSVFKWSNPKPGLRSAPKRYVLEYTCYEFLGQNIEFHSRGFDHFNTALKFVDHEFGPNDLTSAKITDTLTGVYVELEKESK